MIPPRRQSDKKEIHNYDRKIGISVVVQAHRFHAILGKPKEIPKKVIPKIKNQRLSGSDDGDEADDETLLPEFLSCARP